jgi:hypothetical protein
MTTLTPSQELRTLCGDPDWAASTIVELQSKLSASEQAQVDAGVRIAELESRLSSCKSIAEQAIDNELDNNDVRYLRGELRKIIRLVEDSLRAVERQAPSDPNWPETEKGRTWVEISGGVEKPFCARCGSDKHELSEGRCHETPGYE